MDKIPMPKKKKKKKEDKAPLGPGELGTKVDEGVSEPVDINGRADADIIKGVLSKLRDKAPKKKKKGMLV